MTQPAAASGDQAVRGMQFGLTGEYGEWVEAQ